jgi:septal ring factor EnvC (AmiA/AmiB activator)
LLLLSVLALTASAPVLSQAETLDGALKRARAEQAQAEAQTRRFEQAASASRGEAEKLQAKQAAATSAIEAAEARITAADARLRLLIASAEQRRSQLQREQQPIASLLAGLATMARRPPIVAVADQASTDELVKVRVLLDATLPVIRRRTSALTAQLADAQRLRRSASLARQELDRGRRELLVRKQAFAALEAKALKASAAARGQALETGDVALAAGETVEQMRSAESGNRAARALAYALAATDPAPARPGAKDAQPGATLPYVLPAVAAVTEGLGSVNPSGVRSRGLTLATSRGAPLIVPASGIVRFSGPFRSHDGVVIIDHGRGWMSLIVGVASTVKPGDRVTIRQPLGRALGPLQVELSQNGRRVSPAIIAGSSQTLSNRGKGG